MRENNRNLENDNGTIDHTRCGKKGGIIGK